MRDLLQFSKTDIYCPAASVYIDPWRPVDRFSPIRSVTPELVVEIAYEGIAVSNRHKSGVALRFPRIHRWRQDKPKTEANTLEDLQRMLEKYR